MKKVDLTGRRFGRLVVQYELPERRNGRIFWHCKCDCGNEKDIAGAQLTKKEHNTESCGCLQKDRTRLANQGADLSGKRFGRLTVLHRVPNSSKWDCLCDCGNHTIVDTNHLNMGHTQSCGCLQKDIASQTKFKNLTGQRFGLWTVLGLDTEKSTTKKKYYKCLCDCGTIKTVSASNLISGDSQSCGCLNISHGELKIRTLLKEYNIPFETEKKFDDCINPLTNTQLRFDFYVNNQYLIEYNGIQHYEENNKGWDDKLADIQYRDNLKIEWAKSHNIPLIIIPYTKYNELTIDDLLLS